MPFHAYQTSSPYRAENASVAICVVDPYSTGAHVAAEAYHRGFKVIAVWSDECGEVCGTSTPCALQRDYSHRYWPSLLTRYSSRLA